MTPDDIRTWNDAVRELYYHHKSDEVLQLYHSEQLPTCSLSVQTHCILVKAYIRTKNWSDGRQLHAQIRTNPNLYKDQRLKVASRFSSTYQ